MAASLATFGTFLAEIMSDVIGVQWAVVAIALFLAVISIIFLSFSTRLRKSDW